MVLMRYLIERDVTSGLLASALSTCTYFVVNVGAVRECIIARALLTPLYLPVYV